MKLLPIVLAHRPAACRAPGRRPAKPDRAAIVRRRSVCRRLLRQRAGAHGAPSPLLSKAQPGQAAGMPPFLMEMNADARRRGQRRQAGAGRSTSDAEVLDVGGEIACARAFSAQFSDYLHLVKRNGAGRFSTSCGTRPPPPAAQNDTAAVERRPRLRRGALRRRQPAARSPSCLQSRTCARWRRPGRAGARDSRAERRHAGQHGSARGQARGNRRSGGGDRARRRRQHRRGERSSPARRRRNCSSDSSRAAGARRQHADLSSGAAGWPRFTCRSSPGSSAAADARPDRKRRQRHEARSAERART